MKIYILSYLNYGSTHKRSNSNRKQAVLSGLGLCIIFLSVNLSCSGDVDPSVSRSVKQEFEKTYQYVLDHKSTKNEDIENLTLLKKRNQGALATIAYQWHTHALKECQVVTRQKQSENLSSYEKLSRTKSAKTNKEGQSYDQIRPCLAEVYYQNWANIQSMITFHISAGL